MDVQLDLRLIEQQLRHLAEERFAEGDAEGFASFGYSGNLALALVADNRPALQMRGIYEPALLAAFTGTKFNNHQWTEQSIDCLFRQADRDRLRAAGDELPGPGPFRLYRGVAGVGRARRIRGYSWTDSLDVACWFAARHDLKSPAVLTAEVSREEVLAFHAGRDEREFIWRPQLTTRVKFEGDEISERAGRYGEDLLAREKAKRAELLARNKTSSKVAEGSLGAD